MKMRTAILLATAVSLLLGSVVLALSSADALAVLSAGFDLWWHVIAGGGGQSASASYAVSGSIGQPAVGPLSSADYRLGAGFWPGIGAESPTPTPTGTLPPTSTPTATPTPTVTPTRTVSPTPTATATGSPPPTSTPTATSTATTTVTPTTPIQRVYLPIVLKSYP